MLRSCIYHRISHLFEMETITLIVLHRVRVFALGLRLGTHRSRASAVGSRDGLDGGAVERFVLAVAEFDRSHLLLHVLHYHFGKCFGKCGAGTLADRSVVVSSHQFWEVSVAFALRGKKPGGGGQGW